MADLQRPPLVERDIDQAVTALKKGAYLLKYGRRGKPKFCPFRISPDESTLIWYYGKEQKQLELQHVTRIIPGQRTATFQRYPRPEKEYQSFSLLYSDRSLDLICKDKDEAEVWFMGLKYLIARGGYCKTRIGGTSEVVSSDSPTAQRAFPLSTSSDLGDTERTDSVPQSRLGKAFADLVSHTATNKSYSLADTVTYSLSSVSHVPVENASGRSSAGDDFRLSLSSALSSSSQSSCNEDSDSLVDVFIWGEGISHGVLGGGEVRICRSSSKKTDCPLPKALESSMVLDVRSIACGNRHAVLVTKQGEIYSWGEETGGRLGHGVEADISHPKLIDTLTGMNIDMVACGEFHTCAITVSGDLYTWGDGTHHAGLLGHGSTVGRRVPKKVGGLLQGLQVSYVSCGPWHTALVTSGGKLFTFGDGTFGALGHGDHHSTSSPREVEALKGLRTLRVACGVWHTAAVVKIIGDSSSAGASDGSSSGKLFTWGDGYNGQLGHGDNKSRLVPMCIDSLVDINFSQVACGHSLTVALTTSGCVYTMGSAAHGKLGSPSADGKIPTCICMTAESTIQEISCGSHHVAVLTSKSEVYTWGKGANGQLGHRDYDDRNTPTCVDSLKDKQVRSVVCGSNFTAVICLHKLVSGADNSVCSSCHNPFNFRRKQHNCYNCGLAFCKACSSRKSIKASLAPNMNKPYRVCDGCFTKLQKKAVDSFSASKIPKVKGGTILFRSRDIAEKEEGGPHSRLSSADLFNMSEGRSSNSNLMVETNDKLGSSPQNGNAQRGSIVLPKSPTSPLGTSRVFCISIPTSRILSRSTSPVQGFGSASQPSKAMPCVPVHRTDVVLEESNHEGDSLTEEIEYLRTQVEELANKSQLLKAELEIKSRELKEAMALAAHEAEKCIAAKEVIKSLTEQLKEMADRVPEANIATNYSDSIIEQQLSDPDCPSNESSVTSCKNESCDCSTASVFCNGSQAQQKSERVIQDEPGVYITLYVLPGGGNELRRVRFSRKRFTEEQAEKWWTENGTKLCQRHDIITM